ncbi:MAG: hypothetical protein LZF62_170002 [Nitrospira sp.]|nr:MAG: hypothetical protein LZF62_170002 [Nitrospira sp.]
MSLNLEDFRNQQFVGELGLFTPFWGGKPLPCLFHDTCNAAFYMTIDALNRMQASATIGGNQYCIPSISLWFQGTESYLSTLYKLATEDSRITGRSIREKIRVVDKFDAINSYFGTNSPLSLRSRLQEFATFRNCIFHDLTVSRIPQYAHTLFSPHAEKLNEIDLFEAIVISLEVFTNYRYTINNLNLMPQIYINARFDDLDKLASEILFPAFKEILNEKGLTTTLTLSPQAFLTDARNYELQMMAGISHIGPVYPNKPTGSTEITKRYVESAVAARPVGPTQFHVPNYTRTKT